MARRGAAARPNTVDQTMRYGPGREASGRGMGARDSKKIEGRSDPYRFADCLGLGD